MPAKRLTTNPLRCTCAHQPLLAVYGVTDKREIYIHVRVYKARRIYGEMLFTPGDNGMVELRCRECYRWYKIVIRQPGRAELEEVEDPRLIEADQPIFSHD